MTQLDGSVNAGIKSGDASEEYFFAEGCFINELSNSSDDPAVSIARARLAPGETTRWHYLKGTGERYVIQEGTGVVEVHDLPAHVVAAGDVVAVLETNKAIMEQNASVSGEVVEAAYVHDLATVPPRDELLSRIAGGLVGKVRELMMLLDGTTREFAGLIEARAAQMESEGEAG